MDFKFSDANDMIGLKIERNNLAKKLMQTHVDIFTKENEIRNLYIGLCEVKMSILETMNAVEKMQVNEYSKEREESINKMVEDLNTMDGESIDDIKKIHEEIKKIKLDSDACSNEVNRLNEAIPKIGVVTNYSVKSRYADSIGGRCIP